MRPLPHVSRISHATGGLLLALVTLTACSSVGEGVHRGASELNAPFIANEASLTDVGELGGYVDAIVRTERSNYRFLFPADEGCRAVIQEGASVNYRNKGGAYGTVESPKGVCAPVGIMSLPTWRQRNRVETARKPRSPANYKKVWEGKSYTFVRGDFPLASWLSIPGNFDIIAVLPNDAPCGAAVERGTATLDLQARGSTPLTLRTGGAGSDGVQVCVIEGFVAPQSRAAKR